MNIPHTQLSVDINRRNHLTVDLVGHVNDKNTRYLDLQLTANNEVIELEQGCTATVTYTSDNVLIDQDVECDVNGNVIEIGFDSEKVEHARSGILAIQPKITDTNDNVLTLQIPIYVRVSADIAQTSQIDDDSLGSYTEVVREIADARGTYQNLKQRIDNTAAPTDEQVAEAVEDYLGNNPLTESTANKKETIEAQSQTGDSDTNYPTVGAVRDYTDGKVSELEGYVDDELDEMDAAKADKATTLAGYGITDAYTKAEVNGMIPSVPTKVSDLSNDLGFLTLSTLPKYNGGVQ